MPVIFISFTAHRKEDYTDLRWLTAEEINTDHYEVQRSEDGTGFITLSTVPTTNRLTAQEYSYKDFLALNSIAFYRIRCVDRDGRSKFSKTVAVSDRSYLSNNIQVVNTARDVIVINSRINDNLSSVYTIYNEAGKLIQKGSIQLKTGLDNVIRFPFKPAHGIYILKISGTGKEYVNKILVE